MKNLDIIQQQIALTMLDKIGPRTLRTLVSYCGSVSEIFKSSKMSLSKIPDIGIAKASIIHSHKEAMIRAESEVEFIQKYGVHTHFYLEESYPSRLKHHDDAPALIYTKGDTSLEPQRTVGIVGTRTPTPQGKLITASLVRDLQSYDVTILSGLAYGIDAAAHKAAVDSGVKTFGFLGHGLDIIYPSANKSIAEKMIANGGLITEFPSGTKPDRQNFPMRNRVLAMMSDAIIVVESKKKGGSIITAEFGNEYSKDVFAIPGRPSDTLSGGCNGLIKRTKAHLLDTIEDLIYITRWDDEAKPKAHQASLFLDLNQEETDIINLLKSEDSISLDELAYRSKKSVATLSSMLLQLEFKGVVKSLPGKMFMVVK